MNQNKAIACPSRADGDELTISQVVISAGYSRLVRDREQLNPVSSLRISTADDPNRDRANSSRRCSGLR